MNDIAINNTTLTTRLQAAKTAALLAGNIQWKAYGKPIDILTKSSGIDLVTQIDLACDKAILEHLQHDFPNDTFITEESYQEEDIASIGLDHTWVIDPLDGTTNYAHSFPHFAVSIAYFENGLPTVGVIYDVCKDELFFTQKNLGAFIEKPLAGQTAKLLKNSGCSQLEKSLLATGFPYDIATNPNNNLLYLAEMLKRCHGVRRPGAAALDLAYVACGRLDGFWEITLSPWDLAAGVLMIEETGGICRSVDNSPLNFHRRRIDIASAATVVLLDEMHQVLKNAAISNML